MQELSKRRLLTRINRAGQKSIFLNPLLILLGFQELYNKEFFLKKNSLILLMDASFIKIKKLVTQIMKIIIIILIKQVK